VKLLFVKERERRRQQYLLAKAMEARRRFEDREKSKADKKSEKKLQKEKKLVCWTIVMINCCSQ
jgi:hypothetical protein